MIRRPAILGALFATACTGGPDDATVCTDAPVEYAVVSALTFGREDGEVAPGFDLDAHVSSDTDAIGCGHADHTSPDGLPGVDNAFAGLIPVLDATEAQALEPIIQEAIRQGLILLIVEMTDPDASDDACRSMRVLRGTGDPLLGTDGTLLGGQTLELDPESASEAVPATVTAAGTFYAEGIAFDLPIEIFDASLVLEVRGATVEVTELDDGTYTGVLGGGFPYQGVVDGLLETNIDGALKDLLPTVMEGASDLDFDGDGTCESLSVTLEVSALPAFLYAE
jgi:hypothetical protein